MSDLKEQHYPVIHPDWLNQDSDLDVHQVTRQVGEEETEATEMFASLGTNARKELEKYPCTRNYPFRKQDHEWIEGREVGDDRIDMSHSADRLATMLVLQESLFRMKTSKEDTFISTEVFDFCEEKAPIPRNPYGSWDMCRKTGNFEGMEFFDVPKMRTLIDASKNDNSHSDSANGKIELLTKRMATMRNQFKVTHQIAEFIQSANLGSWKISEPAYQPKQTGGLGAKAMFNNPINLYGYMITYKGGARDRVYGTAVEEVKESIRSMENLIPFVLHLCPLQRQNHGNLKHTYDEKVFLLQKGLKTGPLLGKEIMPLYRKNDRQAPYSAIENRMLKTRVTMTETQANSELANYRKLGVLLRTTSKVATEVEKGKLQVNQALPEDYNNSTRVSVAFENLLHKKTSYNDQELLQSSADFQQCKTGVTRFIASHAIFIYLGCKGDIYTVNDIPNKSDIYLEEDVRSVCSLRVTGLKFIPKINGRDKEQITTNKQGLFEVPPEEVDWAAGLAKEIRKLRVGGYPAETLKVRNVLEKEKNSVLANDDGSLLSKARSDNAFQKDTVRFAILISTDYKLAKKIAEMCNITVYLVPPIGIIQRNQTYLLADDYNQQERINTLYTWMCREGSPKRPYAAYLDTGSRDAALIKVGHKEFTERNLYVQYKDSIGFWEKGGRQRTYSVRYTPLGLYSKGIPFTTVVPYKNYKPLSNRRDYNDSRTVPDGNVLARLGSNYRYKYQKSTS